MRSGLVILTVALAAELELLTTSARTRIIGHDLFGSTLDGCIGNRVILVGSRFLCNLFTLKLALNMNTEQHTNSILFDAVDHFLEHVKALELVFINRITLRKCLKTDALTKLIHVVDVVHPLCIDRPEQDDTFNLTELVLYGEFGFLLLIQTDSFFFEYLYKFVFLTVLLFLG